MNRSCLLGLMLLAAPAFAEDPPVQPATTTSATGSTGAGADADAKAAKESQSTTVVDAENRELKPHDVLGFLIDQDPSVVEALRGGNGGSGDAETIFVTDAGEAMFRVTRTSPISVKLSVAGKKLEGVRKELKVLLDAEYYQDCSFRLDLQAVNRSSAMMEGSGAAKVVLYGSGGLSGTFSIIEGRKLMLSDVIISAGGKSGNDFANLKRVKVRRVDPVTNKETVIEKNVKKIIENGDRNADIELKDGDRVEVPARSIIF